MPILKFFISMLSGTLVNRLFFALLLSSCPQSSPNPASTLQPPASSLPDQTHIKLSFTWALLNLKLKLVLLLPQFTCDMTTVASSLSRGLCVLFSTPKTAGGSGQSKANPGFVPSLLFLECP